MSDVFMSYRREDFPLAQRVVAALQAAGVSVWWDERLTARVTWDAALEHEIAAAATVVVLWTPRSVESDWVRTEAHYGQDHGKLIPVMAERCTPPLAFLLRQTIDLCDWQGDTDHRHWRKLLAWIADVVANRNRAGEPNLGQTAVANAFRGAVGRLTSGDPIEDGAFVNTATPAGTAFRDGDALPVMRVLPAGAFLLGSAVTEPGRSSAEGPQRRIEIPLPFALGVFPVLQGEVASLMPSAPGSTSAPTLPATHLSFDDAEVLAATLSARSGEQYRLPSEAEWEYACRAGSRTRYAFGDDLDATLALFGATTGPTTPGTFPANAFGLFDMHGNVREWTADLWHESYDVTPLDGSPALEGHGSMRVVRGGGWSDPPLLLRSAARMRATQSLRANVIGVRLVRVLA